MPRTLWFVAGAGAGVYAMARARRLAESLTTDGLRDRIGAVALGARIMAEEVRAGTAEREVELRERYGVPEPGYRALEPGPERAPASREDQD